MRNMWKKYSSLDTILENEQGTLTTDENIFLTRRNLMDNCCSLSK